MSGTTYHAAISVDADRLGPRFLKPLLRNATFGGRYLTIDEFRAACRELRSKGLAVFPPCNHVDARGRCAGHPTEKGATP